MKKNTILALLVCAWLIIESSQAQEETYSNQKKAYQINHLGISIPLIWNNSNGVFYSTGNRREPEGNAWSYGINLSYSKSIYRNIFGTVGIGYFKQVFGIIRPIDYDTGGPQPLISSKTYAYNSFHFFAGLGYKKELNNSWAINGIATYNLYHSFRQKYTPTIINFGDKQINKNSFSIGKMVNLHLEAERIISKNISVGLGIILPVKVEWEKDSMFFEPIGWSDDENIIAYNKFSIGTNLYCNYNF